MALLYDEAMIIGIPREVKDRESRVALLPRAVAQLRRRGHRVLVQSRAGVGAGYSDADYRAAGATMVPSAARLWGSSELIVKVKEPLPAEHRYFRHGLRLFCYLHLAAAPRLARALQKSGVQALAFETLERNGATPLLKPMSEIAGRLSVTIGAHFLQSDRGGRGVLLSPTDFSAPASVVVIGGGNVGRAAAETAAGLGARVTVFDSRPEPLRDWARLHSNLVLQGATPVRIAKALSQADLAVGAVYVPGARAPRVIRRSMVQGMPPGSVLVDVAVDQGGASETTRPTSHSRPVYQAHGVWHYAVPNMPALVSRTASQALSKVILPYVLQVAEISERRLLTDPELSSAVNLWEGEIVHPELKKIYS
ncbi:MAG TPA: alanine dehydrogenase [bacterium]|nr:alanine dehydrogenase [bacterium]